MHKQQLHCNMYRTFTFFMQMSSDFDLVMKQDGSKDTFERNWELWCPAVIDYALAMKNKSAALKHAFHGLEGGCEGTPPFNYFYPLYLFSPL